jgi:hypothetical protein
MSKRIAIVASSALFLAVTAFQGHAQQPQIPTLQVCNTTGAKGKAQVKIEARADAQHAGTFDVAVELTCDPKNPGYPAGAVQIGGINMSDSLVQGTIASTSIEQLTSTGKHTPTLYVNGRCKAEAAVGCRFWLMIANNRPNVEKGTPDIVSFLVFDGAGQRVAYGTGPVVKGDIHVTPTAN